MCFLKEVYASSVFAVRACGISLIDSIILYAAHAKPENRTCDFGDPVRKRNVGKGRNLRQQTAKDGGMLVGKSGKRSDPREP